ncbi:hypothetical protein CORC01_00372 [Colletotrichum orchidophilum]|uniref:Uncharacterized protein n=1 Tax=Colletotrichum orchidophilum TaxID=1209926 RepID=A0A1G4BSY3_9PEZI|nr:uncharacterized protein CORC01_00372 [Colletotrichum orchidophilum]OHF04520.1 hypothetical protein CORC01_00372 [Colletotrichum orchidophilum]
MAPWTTIYNGKSLILAETPPPPPPKSSPSSSWSPSPTPSPSTPQTSRPPQTTKTSQETFNPSDVPTVFPSSTSAAQKPGACGEDSHCNSPNYQCGRDQKPACNQAANVCHCLALPKPTSKPTSTTTAAKATKNTSKAPYPIVTQWIKDMKIKVGKQNCHAKGSCGEKEVIDGPELLIDAKKICAALNEKKVRLSPGDKEYKSNGLGGHGSKHHFTISWIEGCTFPSKDRTKYGMRLFDPMETREEVMGVNRCENLLIGNWKDCVLTNVGKGGSRDIGCLRYSTGPGEEGNAGTGIGIQEKLKELGKDLGPWETVF